MRNIFGEGSVRAKDASRISFSPSVTVIGGDNSRAFRSAFERGVQSGVSLLESAIEEIRTYWEGTDAQVDASQKRLDADAKPIADSRKVFVIHGRNAIIRENFFGFLRAVGLQPIEWNQAVGLVGRPSPYIGEILDAALAHAGAIIVLFTPDDEGRLRKGFRSSSDAPYDIELTGQARQNVIFEAGMAMGRCPDRTILVELGDLRPFSDVAGRHVVRLNNSAARRQELADRLDLAGCSVDRTGTDWYTVGDFSETQLDRLQPGSSPD